jgi:proteasome lid subunit RPN8/RPN11
MRIEVTSEALGRMRAAAAAAHPREACGILLGQDDRIAAFRPAANVHPTPETHFEIDPRALIDAHREARAGGWQVVGYFHSHPEGPARPSAIDARDAARDGRIWAICGRAGRGDGSGQESRTTGGGKGLASPGYVLTFWRDTRGGFTPLSYAVTSG